MAVSLFFVVLPIQKELPYEKQGSIYTSNIFKTVFKGSRFIGILVFKIPIFVCTLEIIPFICSVNDNLVEKIKPKYLKQRTFSIGFPFKVKLHLASLPSPITSTLVFFRLMLRQFSLQYLYRSSILLCNSFAELASSTKSSAYWMYLIYVLFGYGPW